MSFPWWLVQNGITVTVLLPVVWIVCRLLRGQPAAHHWLWLVLMMKLVLPPLAQWPILNEELFGFPITLQQNDATGSDLMPTIAAPGSPSLSATFLCGCLWVAGSIAALGYAVRAVVATRRLLHESRPSSPRLLRTVARINKRFGGHPVEVRISRHVFSPCVVALGPAVVLWPERLINDEGDSGLEPIVAHELAHLQRGDHWVTWFEMLIGIVWWWNPLFWLVRRQLHETRELACDAMALRATDATPREYSLQLLQIAAGRTVSL